MAKGRVALALVVVLAMAPAHARVDGSLGSRGYHAAGAWALAVGTTTEGDYGYFAFIASSGAGATTRSPGDPSPDLPLGTLRLVGCIGAICREYSASLTSIDARLNVARVRGHAPDFGAIDISFDAFWPLQSTSTYGASTAGRCETPDDQKFSLNHFVLSNAAGSALGESGIEWSFGSGSIGPYAFGTLRPDGQTIAIGQIARHAVVRGSIEWASDICRV